LAKLRVGEELLIAQRKCAALAGQAVRIVLHLLQEHGCMMEVVVQLVLLIDHIVQLRAADALELLLKRDQNARRHATDQGSQQVANHDLPQALLYVHQAFQAQVELERDVVGGDDPHQHAVRQHDLCYVDI
jgi:hypothetical protein